MGAGYPWLWNQTLVEPYTETAVSVSGGYFNMPFSSSLYDATGQIIYGPIPDTSFDLVFVALGKYTLVVSQTSGTVTADDDTASLRGAELAARADPIPGGADAAGPEDYHNEQDASSTADEQPAASWANPTRRLVARVGQHKKHSSSSSATHTPDALGESEPDAGTSAIAATAGGDETTLSTLTKHLVCKYVRREIRSLMKNDLDDFLEAMHTLWGLDTHAGRKLYGKDYVSIQDLTAIHLERSSAMKCDHMHVGLGFLTNHVVLTNLFERAVLAVDPRTPLPYWDYTIDGEFVQDAGNPDMVYDSVLFTEDVFGNASTDTEFTIKSGRWAYTRLPQYQWNATHNSYGLPRAPWNNNPRPYITRVRATDDTVFPYPTCADHFNLTREDDSYYLWAYDVEDNPHGPVHTTLGGWYWVNDGVWDTMAEIDGIVGQDILTLKRESYKWWKAFYRMGKLDCPSACPLPVPEASCTCSCNEEVTTLEQVVEYTANMTITWEWEHLPSADQAKMIDLMCKSGVIEGDQIEAASPYDPSFWPIHPTVERLWQLKKLSSKHPFKSEVWPTKKSENSYYGDCDGHNPDDVIEFSKRLFNDNKARTNTEIYDWVNPHHENLHYIYADFDWSHCSEDEDPGGLL